MKLYNIQEILKYLHIYLLKEVRIFIILLIFCNIRVTFNVKHKSFLTFNLCKFPQKKEQKKTYAKVVTIYEHKTIIIYYTILWFIQKWPFNEDLQQLQANYFTEICNINSIQILKKVTFSTLREKWCCKIDTL